MSLQQKMHRKCVKLCALCNQEESSQYFTVCKSRHCVQYFTLYDSAYNLQVHKINRIGRKIKNCNGFIWIFFSPPRLFSGIIDKYELCIYASDEDGMLFILW